MKQIVLKEDQLTLEQREKYNHHIGYQGYTNYETWYLAMILTNSRDRYEQYCFQAREEIKNAQEHPDEIINDPLLQAKFALADSIKDYVESLVSDGLPASTNETELLKGMCYSFTSNVNFNEIAQEFINKVTKG